MIEPAFIQDLHDRSSEELREIMAHCAGIHVERHGGEPTAETLARIAAASRFHFPTIGEA